VLLVELELEREYLDLRDETSVLERARKEGSVVMQAQVMATFTSTTLFWIYVSGERGGGERGKGKGRTRVQ